MAHVVCLWSLAWFSAFAVGLVSNLYGRFFNGNAFVVMVGSSQADAKAIF